jgi:hypothetical protein
MNLKLKQPPGKPVRLIRRSVLIFNGGRAEYRGTVEAREQREAYLVATDKFDVPIEQQNHLFVRRA